MHSSPTHHPQKSMKESVAIRIILRIAGLINMDKKKELLENIWLRVKIVHGTFRGVPDVWNEGAS